MNIHAPSDDDIPELPLISVVTPSLNQAAFLERTIMSVLEQGYPRLEYMVFDGGSSDGSVDIIKRHAARLAYWTSARDDGQASAVNAGWRRATGEILGWLNSDDFYLPGTLDLVATYFRDHPNVEFVYGMCDVLDDRGLRVSQMGQEFDLQTMLYRHDLVPQPSAFLRRSVIDHIGVLDPTLRYAMDYDFFVRVAKYTKPEFIPRPLSAYTVHGAAKSTRDRAQARRETHLVRKRYVGGLGRIVLIVQSASSRAYHLLPASLRAVADWIRGVKF